MAVVIKADDTRKLLLKVREEKFVYELKSKTTEEQ